MHTSNMFLMISSVSNADNFYYIYVYIYIVTVSIASSRLSPLVYTHSEHVRKPCSLELSLSSPTDFTIQTARECSLNANCINNALVQFQSVLH